MVVMAETRPVPTAGALTPSLASLPPLLSLGVGGDEIGCRAPLVAVVMEEREIVARSSPMVRWSLPLAIREEVGAWSLL